MANGQNPMMPIFNVVGTGENKAPLSESVSQQILNRVSQAQLQGLQEQRAGLQQTQKRLSQLQSQPQQKDLSALFAIGDMLAGTGGQYSQIYQYAKPKDNRNEILALEKMLTQQRQGLADDEINYLKTQFQAIGSANKDGALGKLTPGQKKLDEEFAKEYADFYAGGGYADVEKGLEQLKEVSSALESTDDLTGPVIGTTPNWLRRRFSPESAAAQQAVEEVVQRNLRLILGAQFTEKEGQRLIERAYDPALEESENKKRVDRLMESMKKAADAKMQAAQYFEQVGSLKGYKGSAITSKNQATKLVDQFISDLDGKKSSSGSGGKKPSRFEELKKKYGY